ncbi:MAG: hypothetical protein OXH63_04580 [Gemmatimonadetes bacterium]|nr:hypothetical protein [Gemmatimonadota bacterium]
MLTFPLIGIVLLIGTAAADQDPLADRGNWALGVALPSSSKLSLSLWKVRSPVTALGLEIDVSSYYSEFTSDDLDNPDRYDTRSQHRSLRLQLRPTIKHYRPLHDHVAPFIFYQAHANFYFRNHRLDSASRAQRTTTETDSDLGIALGLGTDWFPFRRISLSGQTGLYLSYRHEEFPNREREWSLKTFQTEVAALVYF